jgi:hypothetical protein
MYLQRVDDWLNAERARIDLPALDLPVSRTTLALHHSPRLRVALLPGAFRLDTDPGPFAEALQPPPAATAASPSAGAVGGGRPQSALQTLVDRFRAEPGGRTVTGTLPVDVSFPEFGPSIFLASELTAEGSVPAIELTLKRARS